MREVPVNHRYGSSPQVPRRRRILTNELVKDVDYLNVMYGKVLRSLYLLRRYVSVYVSS